MCKEKIIEKGVINQQSSEMYYKHQCYNTVLGQ